MLSTELNILTNVLYNRNNTMILNLLWPSPSYSLNNLYTHPFQYMKNIYETGEYKNQKMTWEKNKKKSLTFYDNWMNTLKNMTRLLKTDTIYSWSKISYKDIDPHYDDDQKSDIVLLYKHLLKCYNGVFNFLDPKRQDLLNNIHKISDYEYIIDRILKTQTTSSLFDVHTLPKSFNGIDKCLSTYVTEKTLTNLNSFAIHHNERHIEKITELMNINNNQNIQEIIKLGEELMEIIFIIFTHPKYNKLTGDYEIDHFYDKDYMNSIDDIESDLDIDNHIGEKDTINLFLSTLYKISLSIYCGFIPFLKILNLSNQGNHLPIEKIERAINKLYSIIDNYIELILVLCSYYRIVNNYDQSFYLLNNFINTSGEKFKETIDMFLPYIDKLDRYSLTIKDESILYETRYKTRIIRPLIFSLNRKYGMFLLDCVGDLYKSRTINGKLLDLIKNHPEILNTYIIEWYIKTTMDNVSKLTSPHH